MRKVRRGPENNRWKGGRCISTHGYVLINVGKGAPMADCRGYAYEHRIVAAKILGRPLRRDELVHHKDENRQNNSPDNLEVVTRAEHKVAHRAVCLDHRLPGEDNPVIQCACGCGATFTRYDGQGRPRRYAVGHSRVGDTRKQDALLAVMGPGDVHQVDLAEKAGRKLSGVRTLLAAMETRGVVVKTAPGTWRAR